MACLTLNEGTFKNAMDYMKNTYYHMYNLFVGDLADAMDSYYDAWQSNKGFERVNKLYREITDGLVKAGANFHYNYDVMRRSGLELARKEQSNLSIDTMELRNYSMTPRTFADGREIIITDEKITAASEKINKWIKTLDSTLDVLQTYTSSDAQFGYWSTGDVNPRAKIHDAIVALKEVVNESNKQFASSYEQTRLEDEALRKAAVAESQNLRKMD